MKEQYKLIHHIFLRGLDSAAHVLQKGADFAKEKGTEAELLDARLFPDMFDFKKQIQVFTDNVAGGMARPAGLTKPSMPDTETTFAELIERVKKTKDFVNSINPDAVEGIENVKIKLGWLPEGVHFTPETYLGNYVIQNTLFHLVTAYDILRHKGVSLKKPDFTGPLDMQQD